MNLTAWIVLGLILAIALFFWSLPFWADPTRQPPKHRIGDPAEHQAWLRSMTDPQTPDEIRRAHIGAERLRAAMHEQALVEADAFLHEMTDGGGERG